MMRRLGVGLSWVWLIVFCFTPLIARAEKIIEEDDVMVNRFWTTYKLKRWRQSAIDKLAVLPKDPQAQNYSSYSADTRTEFEKRIELFDQLIQTRGLADEAGIENSQLDAGRAQLEIEYGELKGMSEPKHPDITNHVGIKKLETLVAEVRQRLSQSHRDAEQRTSRLKSLPQERQTYQEKQKQAQSALEQVPVRLSASENQEERQYLDLLLKNARLQKRLSHEKLLLIERQQDLLIQRQEIDNRKLKLFQMRLSRVEKELSLYRKAHSARLEKDVLDRRHELDELNKARQLAKTSEEKFRIRWRISALEEEARLAELKLTLNLWKIALQKQNQISAGEEKELNGLKELIQKAGASPIIGERLRTIYRRLGTRRISIIKPSIPNLHLQLDGFRTQSLETQDTLRNLDDQWSEEIQEALVKLSTEQQKGYRHAVYGTLEEIRRHLQNTEEQLDAVVGLGDQLQDIKLKRLVTLENLEKLIYSHVFWLRDAPAIGREVFIKAIEELDRLTVWASTTWNDPLGKEMSGMSWNLSIWIPLLFLFFFIQLKTRHMVSRLLNADRQKKPPFRAKFWMLFLSLLVSMPIPVLILTFGWWLSGYGWQAGLDEILATLSFKLFVILFLWLTYRMVLVRSHLLAQILELGKEGEKLLSRFSRYILLAYAVTLAPAGILSGGPLEFNSIPRLGYTLFELIVLLLLYPALRKSSPMVKGLIGTDPKSGLWRSWGLIRTLIFILFCGIVAMDIMGYRFGSAQLATNAVASMATILLLTAIYSFSIGLVKKASRNRLQEETTSAPGEASEDRWTFETRLRRFLKNAFVILGFSLLVFFWGIGSGVFNALEGIVLFTFHSESGPAETVSIGNLLNGIVILLITVWIARNIKGIFDAFVFPHLLLDSGARYAVVTITRWALFVTGVFLSLAAIHLSMNRLGWLMAAMGVGIGFGLQEIVANMISGVILLIERPARVGDVLTVGSISGEVKRINIRATTILNWDRQEVIVPNKDFITKEVINWTLADKVMRLVINIGVAYGSDINRVRNLLIDIAKEHPDIRKQPQPAVYFTGHGDSSLDFKLHVYISNPEQRHRVIDQINTSINQHLSENNIEIPFPQRDIHIRSDQTKNNL